MKKLMILALVATVGFGCSKEKNPETEEQKTLYAVGSMFGARLAQLNFSDEELEYLAQGLKDAAKNTTPKVDAMAYNEKMQELFQGRMEKEAVKIKEAGKKFVDDFVAKESATKTASGLAYKVVKEGTGATPVETDVVKVHYHGTLMNGEVFDSSKDRGEPVSFPLNRVIKGWTEGLQTMKVGGESKFVIPSDLAYGDSGAPPKIKGGETLIFTVELLAIEKPEAAAKAPAKK